MELYMKENFKNFRGGIDLNNDILNTLTKTRDKLTQSKNKAIWRLSFEPIDDDDDVNTEQTENPEKQTDKQKDLPANQEKMKVMEEAEEWHEDPIPGMNVTQESSTDESDTDSDSEYTKPARPDTLLNGARKKKKIAATNNLLTPDSTDDLVEGVDNIPTPDDLETPSDLDGELEWEDDTPMTPASDSKKFVEYRDDDAEREKYENTKFRKVEIAGKDYRVDMKVIEPYKKVLSHGGYYGDGLNAIILFSGCYLPDRSRRDYHYVMDNLFLYVISTLELLVAEDYMIVYFHGATPRRQMPSFSWLKRCYQMIDRRLRKNLKGLLMVHPTLWLKTVVLMTKPFISSKFSSKLRFVKTLKELGKIVPMEYIYVPEPVSQYDSKLYQHRPCTSTPVTPSSS
ncbi:Protein prune 2 [Mactra antiquata]